MNQIDESLMVYLKSFDVRFIVSQNIKWVPGHNISRFMNQQPLLNCHVIGLKEFVSLDPKHH